MTIELLSPAKDLTTGIAAIDCGADAVYIGAPCLGARAAATNSLQDISLLVEYAHRFGVKVYVTLNTIIYDDELEMAKQMALSLYDIGVDALITQDMALVAMNLPIELHASTQMDNRTIEEVKFAYQSGFRRVVVAREMPLQQINEIHKAMPDLEIEAFVHGALCVSYSGSCYASQYCFNRSANRGECAQFCRLAFDLVDEDDNVIIHNKHLLSLRDMNRSNNLEQMLKAGVTSFKIEGRLKDINYVRNITAYYRKKLDAIFKNNSQYTRSSYGISSIDFTPNPSKSFNRGFTDYFLNGRTNNLSSPNTPKAIGEYVGEIKDNKGSFILIRSLESFNNGDGLCFFDENHKLNGFRVNRAENNKLYLSSPIKNLKPHTPLYRNLDVAFETQLSHTSSKRSMWADITLYDNDHCFVLSVITENGLHVEKELEIEKQIARTTQSERIIKEISKLGDTDFYVRNINLKLSNDFFIPATQLGQLRRNTFQEIKNIIKNSSNKVRKTSRKEQLKQNIQNPKLIFKNVANHLAQDFYHSCGINQYTTAFELQPSDLPLMTCKFCIRHSLGICTKEQKSKNIGQLFLKLPDGKKFKLLFNCKKCEMTVTKC